ncbi:MAG: alpha/beta hydrolase [Rhodospirillaceae bacterium]|jgi:uncharacterized protein|nr:alpha/beta hydrolase [Rhodospirillaceae bacterium]MBT5455136.1 alpha/beta hydrolase [Rhodospirillaceae bacterium]
MSTLLKLIGVGAGIYLVLLVGLFFFQRTLIYHPDPARPAPAAWGVPDMAAVTLTAADGLSLLAWWKPPQAGDRPVVVFFHGNAGHIGFRGAKVRPYLEQGFGVLLVSWRGYGGNDGKPTEAGLYEDGKAALGFLADLSIAEARIVLYGESLGSGVAVELASRGHGGALVLEAPYTALPRVGAAHYPIFPVRWLMWDKFDSIAKIGGIPLPLYIVHGEQDGVIPVRFGKALLAAAQEPKQGLFIPLAGHNNLYQFGAAGHIVGFIQGVYGNKP